MARHIRWSLILLLVLIGFARGEAPPDRARRAEAIQHVKEGLALLADKNPNGALAKFELAYALVPAPGVQYNIGLAQKELLRYPEAIEAIRRYLAAPGISVEKRREAEALIAEMRAQIVDVELLDLPPGARVTLDGRLVGEAPLPPVPMVTGRHLLEVTADGYEPAQRELSIATGMEPEVPVTLRPTRRNCSALIDANVTGAVVRIDGVEVGETPVIAKLNGGGHTLEVTAPGYVPYRGELAMVAGQTRHVEIELQREPKEPVHKKAWPWTILGLGVTGGAVAAGFIFGSRVEDPYCGTFGDGCGNL